MKIAVHHNLPSGGAKRALYEWVRRLADGHTVHLYRFAIPEPFLDVAPLVHETFTFDPPAHGSTGYNVVAKGLMYRRLNQTSKKMAAAIDRGGYDAAFVHQCQFVQSPMLLRYLQLPSVFFCQEPLRRFYEPALPTPNGRNGMISRLTRRSNLLLKGLDAHNARSATLLLANSYYSRESIYRAYGVWARTNYLGVDVDQFKPSNAPKRAQVVSAGRIHPSKGQDFLVQAIGCISEAVRPELLIAYDQGSSEDVEQLTRAGQQAGVRVRCERIAAGDMPRVYNESLLTVYAPVLEPLGLVPLESMACETPVVGIREAGVRETVLHGTTGLLTERDPQEFGAAVESLLTDQPRRTSMGIQGRAHVLQEWTWERSTASLVRHLNAVIK